ncbi:hypothetical protein HY949_02700 [Candidatus Gottesmanbacteria bacterium]|nr:hypothetical protein [Candidatus Gottesmanbacteria bacterium]
MALSKELRPPIKGMPSISEEEAKELVTRAHEAVGGRLTAGPGENQGLLDTLQGMREMNEYRILASARQLMNEMDAWAHERDVVTPVEEWFAQQYDLTADDLETAWSQRREGIRGRLFRQEIENKAALRDDFFSLIDAIGLEEMGEGYEYGQFIAGTTPNALLQAVQSRIGPQD